MDARTPTPPEKVARLKFALGSYPLFSVPIRSVIIPARWSSVPPRPEVVQPRFDRLPRTVQAVVKRCCPLDRPGPRLARSGQSLCYVMEPYEHYYVDLRGSFADYLSRFSSRSRSTLTRKVKKFAQGSGGLIDFREYRHPLEMDEFYRHGRHVSAMTYQERLLDAGLPSTAEFCADMARLAAQDQVRAYLLFKDDRPIAYLYLPVQDGVVMYDRLGYDPAFAAWSPGTVLHYLALERLFAEQKYLYLDLTEGEGQHKRQFATGSARCANMYFFRPTLGNWLLALGHLALTRLSRQLIALLDRCGLKSNLKQLLRPRPGPPATPAPAQANGQAS
jgi:hypothetical protein